MAVPVRSRFSVIWVVVLGFLGCDGTPGQTAADTIEVTSQQLRAGAGQAGEVFLGLDLLTTEKSHAAVGCSTSSLAVEVSYSLQGQSGPFVPLAQDAVEVTCGDGTGGDFALVVDNSGSEDGWLSELKHSARDVVHEVLTRGGRASLVRVSTDAEVMTPMTDDRPALEEALNGMFVRNGWTALYDGIRMGNETLGMSAQADADVRYADADAFCSASAKLGVVVFTDGRENNSMSQSHPISERYPGDELDTDLEDLKNLRVAGITTPVYTVGLGDDVDHASLQALAEHTGGRHLAIEDKNDIPRTFDVISDYAQARHQVCTELPADTCGPMHVRVSYEITTSKGRKGGGRSDNGERVYYMDVPCEDQPGQAVDHGGIATILLALSDADMAWTEAVQLASQTVAWVSTTAAPRVLVVLDDNHHGEHRGDSEFVAQALEEGGFDVTLRQEPEHGLVPEDLAGFDVVWLANPGYPIDDAATFESLMAFTQTGGGVVLQGDDMSFSHGQAFSMTPATGLTHGDNGVTYCGKATNNNGGAYAVRFADGNHPILDGLAGLSFRYRDDIDTTEVADPDMTVLAWATAEGVEGCADKPVIVVRR